MFEINGKYASAAVYATTVENEAISQLVTLCNQPMFENASIKIMPDCHSGAGCVIGFTSIINNKKIIPNLVGVDIGCGVYTLTFKITEDIDYFALDDYISKNIPSGFGIRPEIHPSLNMPINDPIASKYGAKTIADCIQIICKDISDNKLDYHLCSVGSLGGGNHFIEVEKGNDYLSLSIHTGSRNLGKCVCEYYQKHASDVDENTRKRIIEKHKTAKTPEEHKAIQDELCAMEKVPKELSYLATDEMFDAYIKDMLLATIVARRNREIIAEEICNYLSKTYKSFSIVDSFHTIHNYVDILNDGRLIIRKGAIDASEGKKLVIPLNMRDGIIIGTGKGNPSWNYSAPHGAGRLMSRSKAKENISLEEFQKSMEGINTWSVNESTIDESPQAYKPIEEIVSVVGDTISIDDIIIPVYNFKAST